MEITFDKYEKRGAYHWQWYETNQHEYRDLVNRSISYLEPPGRVLDVGCGDGLCAYHLFKRGFQVHGIDTSRRAIQLAEKMVPRAVIRATAWRRIPPPIARLFPACRRHLAELHRRVRFDVASLFDLSGARYDQALMQEVIEHVEDARGAVQKLANLVNDFAVITTPNAEFIKKHELDYHNWNATEFMDLFSGYRAELLHVDRRNLIVKLRAA